MSLVDPTRPEPRVPVRRTSRGTVVVSLALHVVVLAAVVVVPLFGRVTLPDTGVTGVPAFVLAVAAPPVPPPAMGPSAPARATRSAAAPTAQTQPTAAVPLAAPDGIRAGEPPSGVPVTGLPTDGAGYALGVDGGLPDAPVLSAPPPPPAPARPPMRVGGDIRPPRKLQHVAPVYPAIAAEARITGTVVVEATISRAGTVSDVRVLRSVPLLDAAAVAAVRQWRYESTRLNGEPVAVLLTVTIRFGS
jgi:protein TonB